MTDTLHPARSTDFLSRLHDGELSAADREAFTRHRVSCQECREASEAYAQALAAFRASPTSPPAADLSARILRRIRAQSPSRRPFGVMFGIDVRWAGIVIAALLVLLISTPLVLRAPRSALPTLPSLTARIVDAPAPPSDSAAGARTGGGAKPETAPRRVSPLSAPAPARDEGPGSNATDGPRLKSLAPEGPAEDEPRRADSAAAPAPPAARAAQAAPTLRRLRTAEPAGGEGGVASTTAELVEPAGLRLVVQAFDGQGPAPALVAHPADARLAGLRGREFVLTVEAQGRVRAVQESAPNGFLSRDGAQAVAPAIDGLRELRFAPGDRPRRLLVRVE